MGIAAILSKNLTYKDYKGLTRTLKKYTQIRVIVMKAGSLYSDGKGLRGKLKNDNYVAVYGTDSFAIEPHEFKTID